MNNFSDILILSILDYLSYEELFHKQKSIISKSFHTITQKLLKIAKTDNEICNNFLSLYWEKIELENIPIILYCPNRIGVSLKTRLFRIFDTRKPHDKLFISNIFTNKLNFMIKPLEDHVLFVEFVENKLSYIVHTRAKKQNSTN